MNVDALAWTEAAARLGAGLCVGLGAMGAAVGEGRTANAAVEAEARQPGASMDLLGTMLTGQAVAESASVFSLVIAVVLLFSEPTQGGAAAYLAAGLCMGLGAIGPGVGAGLASEAACRGVGRIPQAHSRIQTVMIIGQAVAQTPVVFALMTSILLIYTEMKIQVDIITLAAVIGSGLCMGLGAIGPGVGAGLAAYFAVDETARKPHLSGKLMRAMLTGQAVSQSTAMYALVVSLALLTLI